MKKRMLTLLLIGVMTANMNIGALAAEEVQNEETVNVAVDAENEEEATAEDTEEAGEVAAEDTDEAGEVAAEDTDEAETAAADNTDEEETTDVENTDEEETTDAENTEEAEADTPAEETQNGWSTLEGGGACYYVDGELLKEGIYQIDDKMYGFDQDGNLYVDRMMRFRDDLNNSNKYYVAGEDGVLLNGWISYDDSWYYADEENYELYIEKVLEEDGKQYYFGYNGCLACNCTVDYNGKIYNTNEEGVLTEGTTIEDGWVSITGGVRFYRDGKYVVDDIVEYEGKEYYLDYIGFLGKSIVFESHDENNKSILLMSDEQGVVIRAKNKWYKQYGTWYYYGENQALVTDGVYTINGKQYCFDKYGEMATSSYEKDGKYYFLDANGAVVNEITEEGWVETPDGNWCYLIKTESGSLERIKDEMVVNIENKVYYFDEKGILVVNTIFSIEDAFYYADQNGVIQTNCWIKYNGNWYYAGSYGALCKNELAWVNGKKYYFDECGTMKTGIIRLPHGEICITDNNGAIIEKDGWIKKELDWYYLEYGWALCNTWLGNHTYYLLDNGVMAVGTVIIDDVSYYFDTNGVCQGKISDDFTGWKWMDGYWYYNDQNRQPYTGLLNDKYYISDGKMVTNSIVKTEKGLMYFDVEGNRAKTGWHKFKLGYAEKEYWTYVDEKGLVVSGWQKIDGAWYHFRTNGRMNTGSVQIGDEYYLFESSGRWIDLANKKQGWHKIEGEWYYFESDGQYVRDEDKVIDGKQYSFDRYGVMKHNRVRFKYGVYDVSQTTMYWIGSDGAWTKFSGWKKDEQYNEWYYSKADGTPMDGLLKENGSYYYLDRGCMKTGYVYVPEWNGTYFFNASGRYQNVTNGWAIDANGEWYYFVNGKPVKDAMRTINGKTYFFDLSGVMVAGRFNGYLFAKDGRLIRNAWYKEPDTGNWYYADNTGHYVYGERRINGKKYWFDSKGIWIK